MLQAVKRGNHYVVKILLDQGANFATMENAGLKLSMQLQLPEITEIINSHISR